MRGIVSEYQMSQENQQTYEIVELAAQNDNMVPKKEFENLKLLTNQLEREAAEVIEKKEGHIRCLIDEIAFLKESFKTDFEELRLQHELSFADVEMKLRRT